jgi:hypothetical protein
VNCETQEEVDALWSALSDDLRGGTQRMAEGTDTVCSWQIIPSALGEGSGGDPDPRAGPRGTMQSDAPDDQARHIQGLRRAAERA